MRDATVWAEPSAGQLALRAQLSGASAAASSPAARAWRVELPAFDRWSSDTLEVRLTSRTGEAETTAIARIPAAALRAIVAPTIARGRAVRAESRD